MTYEGLGTVLFRFAGLILIGSVFFSLIPAVASGPATLSQAALTGSITLLPGAVLVVASRPLGRFLAAGLE